MGAWEDENFWQYPKVEHDAELIASLPESFDARDKWPNCPSLNEIRDQGSCGSCWAFGAVAAMTDRYCIYSNGTKNFHFSAQDLTSCCSHCGAGCYGGLPWQAWVYWRDTGIVSGVPTPKCVKFCDSSYNSDYDKDKRRGKSIYTISSDEEQIKAELFKNGPVEVSFVVYEDFLDYKKEVYKHTVGSQIGKHAVKMLGWGVENGQKYWLIANSWNPDWGDKGYFKILRGENHCNIESKVIAGEPLIK
ncbi:hypothetical protein PYW07_017102 [Mythimna separata]|uniref:Peptidase C1A papain C-terminal domain-containing protein n=1 Tax=Mythimna separata TaxID=271217 RepID=A0AAD7YX30_MYTSE|nr:hypothetical protein PYW07_017102 [Mythimna separata]